MSIFKQKPLVSIIIPTYNSASTLKLCLKSIYKQTYDRYEIIIVDRGSNDSTIKIAQDYDARIYTVSGERSIQKNFGASKSNGEILYFIDSDFYLHPQVIEEGVNLVKKGFDAIIVWNISWPRPSFVAKARYYERLSYYGSEKYEAARFVKKDIFHRAGGFNTKLYFHEDYTFHSKLKSVGAKITRTRKSFEIHLGEPKSLSEFINKNLYYGKNFRLYLKQKPEPIHLMPIRHTFFKKEFISYVARKWLPGAFIVFFIKNIQAFAIIVGTLLDLKVNPYRN